MRDLEYNYDKVYSKQSKTALDWQTYYACSDRLLGFDKTKSITKNS